MADPNICIVCGERGCEEGQDHFRKRESLTKELRDLRKKVEELERESRVARIKLDRHHRTGLCSECKNKLILVAEGK